MPCFATVYYKYVPAHNGVIENFAVPRLVIWQDWYVHKWISTNTYAHIWHYLVRTLSFTHGLLTHSLIESLIHLHAYSLTHSLPYVSFIGTFTFINAAEFNKGDLDVTRSEKENWQLSLILKGTMPPGQVILLAGARAYISCRSRSVISISPWNITWFPSSFGTSWIICSYWKHTRGRTKKIQKKGQAHALEIRLTQVPYFDTSLHKYFQEAHRANNDHRTIGLLQHMLNVTGCSFRGRTRRQRKVRFKNSCVCFP